MGTIGGRTRNGDQVPLGIDRTNEQVEVRYDTRSSCIILCPRLFVCVLWTGVLQM